MQNKTLMSALLLIGCVSAQATTRTLPPAYNPAQVSNAFKTPGTAQITRFQEAVIYAGTGNSSSLPANYRDVPDVLDSSTVGGTAGNLAITKTQHAQMVDCGIPVAMAGSGLNSALITDRIKHCAQLNPTVATWDASVRGRGGEAVWKLVSRVNTTASGSTTSREVWQDQRTGLLWSSKPNMSIGRKADEIWCAAAGNNDSNDPFALCNNDVVSYCSETLFPGGQAATAGAAYSVEGENYQTGVYSNSKGQMGLKSQPSVRWRLPTRNDFMQAEIDGIRFVMPDMLSAQGVDEPTATIVAKNRALYWFYSTPGGQVKYYQSSTPNRKSYYIATRCVGR